MTPVFGAIAFCTTNIEDFRTPLTSTSLTISLTYSSQKRSLRWTSSKWKIIEVIEVDQLEDTNKERLRRAMPHSELKPKDNDPKEKTTFHGRRPLMEGGLWWKTTFDGRWSLTEGDLWQKTTFDGRWPLTEIDLWRKTTFDKRQPLTEDNLWQKKTFDGRRS